MTDTSPVALQVVEFVRGEEYARFTRIIFDTAPTGHTLRFLSVPDFVEASLEKVGRLDSLAAALPGRFDNSGILLFGGGACHAGSLPCR